MPSSETIELRKIKGVVGDIDDLPKYNPRTSIISRIRSLMLRIVATPQLIHLYGALEVNQTITLPSGENNVKSVFSDGNYLYAGVNTTPGKIVKIDLGTFTIVSTLTLNSGENSIYSLCSDGTYLYAGCYVSTGKIVKIDLDSFTRVSALTLSTSNSYVDALFSDGTYLYAGIYTGVSAAGKVVKISLSTFAIISTLTLASAERDVTSLCSDGTYLYAGCYVSTGKVVKIDLGSFTKVSTLDTGGDIRELFSDGFHLYVGLGAGIGIPGKVVKVDLYTFTVISTLSLNADESIYSLFSDGTYLYTASWATPGKIIKIDLSTFTRISTLTLGSGENYTSSLFSDGTYLFAGLNTTPGKIVRRYIIPTSNFIERKISLIHENVGTGGVEDGTDAQLTVANGTSEVTIKTFDIATYNTGLIKAFKIDLDKATSGFQTLGGAASTIIVRVYEKIDVTNYRLRSDDGNDYTWTQGVAEDKVIEVDDISFSKDCQIRVVLSAAPSGTISLPWLSEMNKNMRM